MLVEPHNEARASDPGNNNPITNCHESCFQLDKNIFTIYGMQHHMLFGSQLCTPALRGTAAAEMAAYPACEHTRVAPADVNSIFWDVRLHAQLLLCQHPHLHPFHHAVSGAKQLSEGDLHASFD
jgi:hypothetical protein